MVWVLGAEGTGKLSALSLTTGKVVFSGASITGAHKFSSLIVVHGKILASADGALHRWGP